MPVTLHATDRRQLLERFLRLAQASRERVISGGDVIES